MLIWSTFHQHLADFRPDIGRVGLSEGPIYEPINCQLRPSAVVLAVYGHLYSKKNIL